MHARKRERVAVVFPAAEFDWLSYIEVNIFDEVYRDLLRLSAAKYLNLPWEELQ